MPKKEKDQPSIGIQLGDHANVKGDIFTGDKTVYGDKSAVAHGKGSTAQVTESGISGEELAKLFAPVYQKIEARPDDPKGQKEKIKATVEKIEKEAAKGEGAREKKVNKWLQKLAAMAPDIFEVIITSLAGPAAGLGKAFQLIAKKAKEETAGKS